MTLIKYEYNLYIEDHKILLREIIEDPSKCRETLCPWIRNNAISTKPQKALVYKTDKLLLKFVWKDRGSQRSETTLKRNR